MNVRHWLMTMILFFSFSGRWLVIRSLRLVSIDRRPELNSLRTNGDCWCCLSIHERITHDFFFFFFKQRRPFVSHFVPAFRKNERVPPTAELLYPSLFVFFSLAGITTTSIHFFLFLYLSILVSQTAPRTLFADRGCRRRGADKY